MLKAFAALLLGLACAAFAHAADDTFVAGKNWFAVEPPQPTTTGDKIEVLEVFSYACPACNLFQPTMRQAQGGAAGRTPRSTYLPAAFRPDEDWPVFQRAFFAAQALGIVDKTHDAMFDAIWKERHAARSPIRSRNARQARCRRSRTSPSSTRKYGVKRRGIRRHGQLVRGQHAR